MEIGSRKNVVYKFLPFSENQPQRYPRGSCYVNLKCKYCLETFSFAIPLRLESSRILLEFEAIDNLQA